MKEPDEPSGDRAADVVAEVRAAVCRTVSAGTARIVCTSDTSYSLPQFPSRRQRGRVGRVLFGALKGAGKLVGKAAYRPVARGRDPLHHQTSEGVIDLVRRRSMVDFGSYAAVQIGTQRWSGRSGRPRATLPAEPARAASPLWLIELLGGMVRAGDEGVDEVAGEHWRRLA